MTSSLQALATRLPADNEAALIMAPHNLCYFTGFPSGESYILVSRAGNWFLTDFRYIELAQQTVKGAQCRMISSLTDALSDLAKHHGIQRIYLESSQVTLAEEQRLTAGVSAVTFITDATLDGWIRTLRIVKREDELKKIEAAQAITEEGFSHILPLIREGVTERELALELEFFMRKRGAEQVAFDFIVVSGANSALPHGIPTDKPLARGDFITMDFGATVEGYRSDMTRTVALGEVTDEQRRIYQTVLEAQQAALSALKPGLPCVEGDAAARRVIAAAGYGEAFGHGTGHGVGVEIHEAPNLSPRAGDTRLQVGNVVTVEPGIYLEGRFGVRIEDMVVITEDGCRNLTSAPKELMIL